MLWLLFGPQFLLLLVEYGKHLVDCCLIIVGFYSSFQHIHDKNCISNTSVKPDFSIETDVKFELELFSQFV